VRRPGARTVATRQLRQKLAAKRRAYLCGGQELEDAALRGVRQHVERARVRSAPEAAQLRSAHARAAGLALSPRAALQAAVGDEDTQAEASGLLQSSQLRLQSGGS